MAGTARCFAIDAHACWCQVDLFKNRVENYLSQLVSRTMPAAVAIAMIYYPDERPGNGWAEQLLSLLGYNRDPGQLQALIRALYREATSRIVLPGTVVVPCPLHEAMDGTVSTDYCERVEPSPAGSAKLAALVLDRVQAAVDL